jgi:predicted small lipoprotein YifL
MSHRLTPAPGRMLKRRRLLALLGLCAAGVVAACGKKGPLRLPEPESSAAESPDEEAE